MPLSLSLSLYLHPRGLQQDSAIGRGDGGGTHLVPGHSLLISG